MSASIRDRNPSPASPNAGAIYPVLPEDLGKCPLMLSNCDLAALGLSESHCQFSCEDVTSALGVSLGCSPSFLRGPRTSPDV